MTQRRQIKAANMRWPVLIILITVAIIAWCIHYWEFGTTPPHYDWMLPFSH